MSTTPPRNVIYYNDGSNPISLAGISGLPYTDVILAFLIPDDNFNLTGQGGAFDSNGNPNPNDVQALQNAGKNVLISVGGDIEYFPSSAWQHYAQDVNGLVDQLVEYVRANGLNGVDIDYEDDSGFTGAYDGITFLINLTNLLAGKLPAGQNIITHAPAPGYFNPDDIYNDAYTKIWEGTGSNISWFNCQFYNNPPYDAPASSKVSSYETFAGTIGAPALLVGAPVGPDAAGSGYLRLDEFTSQVIGPLQQTFGSAFGGVMGWEFSYDQGGTWAKGIAQALAGGTGTPTPTPGQQYTIQPGDTLNNIATAAYGAANADQGVTAIEAANPGIDPDDLQIGQEIYIPVLGGTGTPTPGQQYTIQPGDTLNNIATAAYGAANADQGVTAIEAANPGIDPDDLQIGQEIYIPVLGGTGTPTPGQQYTIQPGDTLNNIATAAYGAANADQGVTAIEAANPGIDPDDLQIGQEIYIPVLGGTGTPTPGQQYTIQPGDTLNNIATAAYGAANADQGVTAIEAANPGIDPDDLQIGQEIYIPVLN